MTKMCFCIISKSDSEFFMATICAHRYGPVNADKLMVFVINYRTNR